MKPLTLVFIVSSIFFLSGCANDIVNIEQTAVQKYNLADTDRDGVIEARDKCADTLLGANIDNSGCSNGQKNTTDKEHQTTMKWTIYTANRL